MGDLKPCPCGSTRVEDAMRTGAIECIDCGFSAPTRKAWNTRATPPEVTALVEALRQIENGDDWWAAQTASEALAKWEAAQC